jgi:hypothetical protein
MKTRYKAIAIGCATEAFFASLFALGGFGPCGPTNPLGFIGMLAHFFPGMFIAAGIEEYFKLSDIGGDILIVLIQAIFWSAISFQFVKRGGRSSTHRT